MLSLMFVAGLLAMQASAALTPEKACGPAYHVFSLDPSHSHPAKTTSLEALLSNDVVVEGVVSAKRTYSPGSGVENDVTVHVNKILKGHGVPTGGDIMIHVAGGYAGSSGTCWQDTVDDGARVAVGTSYLVVLTKEEGSAFYRAYSEASWFSISLDGSLVPLTPALIRNHALSDKKIVDIEQRAAKL